jgi:hypothetical protein
MNEDSTDYETERPQVAADNVDFFKDKVSRIMKGLVTPLLVLVHSIGLASSGLARDNQRPRNEPNVATITVEVDPRVELIGIVFRLAGNPEFNEGVFRGYVKDIERHFGDFDGHPAVKLAARLRSTRQMSCDGPMSLAVHIDRDFRPRKAFQEWPWGLDSRWQKQETLEFLEKLRQFAAETKFNEFFKAHGALYQTAIRSCEAVMAQHDLRTWLYEFFGVKGSDDLKLVLGFTNGFSNYGLGFTAGATREKYAIIAIHLFDPDGNPVFRPKQLATTAHEFCHSFANPIVDKYMDQLQPAGEKLYAAHASAMQRIGYQKWQSMMYESAVRACVASFVRSAFEPIYLGYYLKEEAGYGFVWTEGLSDLLQTYEANREKYATFESFFPEFVTFFNKYSKKAEP